MARIDIDEVAQRLGVDRLVHLREGVVYQGFLEPGHQHGEPQAVQAALQQDVAVAAGVSRSTLHTIEHGGAGVRWEKVIAVAAELGLKVGFTEV